MSRGSSGAIGESFTEALHADAPASDRADKLQLYSWLVGNWELRVVLPKDDGTRVTTRGSVHADWVLEGRAIQDVFAVPGPSLRFYDPHIDAWQVFWMDPLRSVFFHMLGRAEGI